jgi:hypothetical protein
MFLGSFWITRNQKNIPLNPSIKDKLNQTLVTNRRTAFIQATAVEKEKFPFGRDFNSKFNKGSWKCIANSYM